MSAMFKASDVLGKAAFGKIYGYVGKEKVLREQVPSNNGSSHRRPRKETDDT